MLVINLVGLLLTPFILKYVTKEEYALFYVAADLLMWLSLAQLGVSNSYNSMAAMTFGKKDYSELSKLSSTAWILQILSGIVVLILGFVLSFFVADFFDIKNTNSNVQVFFLLMVAGTAFTLMNQVYSALLTSAKEIHISNRISIVSVIPKVLFTIIFLLLGWKLFGLALANLLAVLVPIIISFFYVRKRYNNIEISLNNWSSDHAKKLLITGIWFSVGGVAGVLILGLDRIVIAKVVSLEVVAGYLITQKLFFLSDKVLSQIFNVSRPFFGQLYGQNSVEKMKVLYEMFTKIAIFFSVSAALIIMVVNETFIDLWVGKDFYLGKLITFWLAINFIVQFNLLPNRVLLATTLFQLKSQNLLRVLEGVVNFILSILLGKYYGISGVIAGSVISSFLFSNLVFNFYCDRFFKQNGVRTNLKIYLNYGLITILLFYFSVDIYFKSLQMNIVVFALIAFFLILYGYFLFQYIKKSGLINFSRIKLRLN